MSEEQFQLTASDKLFNVKIYNPIRQDQNASVNQ